MKLSASGKEWKLSTPKSLSDEIIAAAKGSNLLAGILASRGLDEPHVIKSFLDPTAYQATSPMEFADMLTAVARIMTAIDQEQQITVYGDYDVDGVTGTSALVKVLSDLKAKVDFYIPNRLDEGYGLNLKAISILASKKQTKLIITCDCGVSNFSEISFAKSLGLDTIIADHHTMPELLPPAVAILHPKLLSEEHPLYHLSGVGVAYKLCEALLIHKGREAEAVELLDYVTLGLIADMVPLIKENRYLVQIGLPKLKTSKRPGVKALLSKVGNTSQNDIVGFGLAPRINAAGRLTDATVAVELLTTEDTETAERLASHLELENRRRQELCEQVFFEAEQMVAKCIDLSNDKAIVIYKEGWHHGVVGIVASRLVEKYRRPVFIGELDEVQGILKGSARGVDSIDLYEVLKANSSLMTRWGGHKMAAGFSLNANTAEAFKIAITQTCNRMLMTEQLHPVIDIDAAVTSDAIGPKIIEDLAWLSPYGVGNKKPVLVIENLLCKSVISLGKEGKHARILLQDDSNQRFEAIIWNAKKVPESGHFVDLAFCPEINSYRGQDNLRLVTIDWRDTSNNLVEQQVDIHTEQVISVLPIASTVQSTFSTPGITGGANLNEASDNGEKEIAKVDNTGSENTSSTQVVTTISMNWKDLRNHPDKNLVLQTALRRLSNDLIVFAESTFTESALEQKIFLDRNKIAPGNNLLFWSYPPSLQIFKDILAGCRAQNVYLVGEDSIIKPINAPMFLQKLIGLVRFAVNKREGKAESMKLAAALGVTEMCIALGLSVLKKLHAIDWFVEDGVLYLDMIDQPVSTDQDMPEHYQLAEALKNIVEFRQWCAAANLNEIQTVVVPNFLSLRPNNNNEMKDEFPSGDKFYAGRAEKSNNAPT